MGIFFGFAGFLGIAAAILQIALDKHKAKKEQLRKEQLIHNFVDDALAKNELYPLWDKGHTLHGISGGSSYRAAKEFSLSPDEAHKLIAIELDKRGLSPINETLQETNTANYVLKCSQDSLLIAKGQALTFRDKNGAESVIPVSALHSIHLDPNFSSRLGSIRLVFLKSSTVYVNVGGAALGLGDDATYYYDKDQSESAEALYQYILSILYGSPDETRVVLSDELVKLKTLLDQGALSQEEFDAAKKKLLDL